MKDQSPSFFPALICSSCLSFLSFKGCLFFPLHMLSAFLQTAQHSFESVHGTNKLTHEGNLPVKEVSKTTSLGQLTLSSCWLAIQCASEVKLCLLQVDLALMNAHVQISSSKGLNNYQVC